MKLFDKKPSLIAEFMKHAEALIKKPSLSDRELKQLGAYNVMLAELQSVSNTNISILTALDYLLGQYDHPEFVGEPDSVFALLVYQLKAYRNAHFSELEASDRSALIVFPQFLPVAIKNLLRELFSASDLNGWGLLILITIEQLKKFPEFFRIGFEDFLLVRYFSYRVLVGRGGQFLRLSLFDILCLDFDAGLKLSGHRDFVYQRIKQVFSGLEKQQWFEKIVAASLSNISSPQLGDRFLDHAPSTAEFEAHIDGKITEWLREERPTETNQAKLQACFGLQNKMACVARGELTYGQFLEWCRLPKNNLVFTTVLLPIDFPESLEQVVSNFEQWLDERSKQLNPPGPVVFAF